MNEKTWVVGVNTALNLVIAVIAGLFWAAGHEAVTVGSLLFWVLTIYDRQR